MMLLLPKRLESEDVIIVTGNLENNARMMSIGLVTGTGDPDYQNVACQLEVNFPSNGTDRIAIKIIQDGNYETVNDSNPATDYFTTEEFTVQFKVRDHIYLYIYVGPSYLEQIQLKHSVNDIRYLAVSGDMKLKKMEYEFANKM